MTTDRRGSELRLYEREEWIEEEEEKEMERKRREGEETPAESSEMWQ